MPGLYLIVERQDGNFPYLQRTEGGYPHLTVAYSKNAASFDFFKLCAGNLLNIMRKELRIERAVRNSFPKNGKTRYDVLFELDDSGKKFIEGLRTSLNLTSNENSQDAFTVMINNFDLIMREPHVTAFTDYEESVHNAHYEEAVSMLPFTVKIIGVSVD